MPKAQCQVCQTDFYSNARHRRYCSRACYVAFLRTSNAATVVERFWSKVNKIEGGCWLWTAATSKGYGQWRIPAESGQQSCPAHRWSWEHFHGPIPAGLSVLHHCDTPRCVNPNHLFLGTQTDNMRDASRKGRLTIPRSRRLTMADRLAIQAAPRDRATGAKLAAFYGVSKIVIHQCRVGRFVGARVTP